MFEIYDILWLLLPIAVFIGWWYAKRDLKRHHQFLYTLSLRYFLEEKHFEVDKTLAALPNMDAESQHAEICLMIGDLFRKRGEIGRAVAIHEHVVNITEISEGLRDRAYWSLTEDYIMAGFWDRAEDLLRKFIETHSHSHYSIEALLKLSQLYEKQRDWLQAITILERLPAFEMKSYQNEIAHFYCELAEEAETIEKAMQWVELAFLHNPDSVRATLIKAKNTIQLNNYPAAFEVLLTMKKKLSMLPLILPVLYRVALILGKTHIIMTLLNEAIEKQPHIQLIQWKVYILISQYSAEEGYQYLTNYLQMHSNLQGVIVSNQLAPYQKIYDFTWSEMYRKTFSHVVNEDLRFRCESCGFMTKILHWRCPSCQRWDMAMPCDDIVALRHAS